jgi:hypothetical protein
MNFIKYLILENKTKMVFLTISIILLYIGLTLPIKTNKETSFLSKFDVPQNRTVIVFVDENGNFQTKLFTNGDFKLINQSTLEYKETNGVVVASRIFAGALLIVLLCVTIWGDDEHNWNFTKCQIKSIIHKISVDVENHANGKFYYYYIKNKLIIKSDRKLSSGSDDLTRSVKSYLEYPKLCLDYEGTTSRKRDNKLTQILN